MKQTERVAASCKGCKRAVYVEHLDRDGYCTQADGSPCPQRPAPPSKPRAAGAQGEDR